jgi:hypothetical protein
VLDGLLDMQQLDAGTCTLELAPTSASRLASDALQQVAPRLRLRPELTADVQIEAGIPPLLASCRWPSTS